MPLELALATPQDEEAITRFLLEVFQLPPSAPFVQRDLLRWKYFEPRPDWDGSRSYVLKQDGRIHAHACVVPVVFPTAGGPVTAIRLIDWAGGRGLPGSGVLLLKKLMDYAGAVIAVSGSEQTQKVLPRIGFQVRARASIYARATRPWRQFRTDPFPRGWKAPFRLARNVCWSLALLPAVPRGWTARPIPRFDSSLEHLLTDPGELFTRPRRSPEMMNYMLRCPGAIFTAFEVRQETRPRGYFVLSRVAGQTRIAELWVDSGDPEDWRALCSLAVHSAAADPDTCEIFALASIGLLKNALAGSRLRLRRQEPIFVYDPRELLRGIPELNIGMIEGDEAYQHNAAYPYET